MGRVNIVKQIKVDGKWTLRIDTQEEIWTLRLGRVASPSRPATSCARPQRCIWEVLGKTPELVAMHAGLECGVIGEKHPGMRMISLKVGMLLIISARSGAEGGSARQAESGRECQGRRTGGQTWRTVRQGRARQRQGDQEGHRRQEPAQGQ
jgi:hypothetical protein